MFSAGVYIVHLTWLLTISHVVCQARSVTKRKGNQQHNVLKVGYRDNQGSELKQKVSVVGHEDTEKGLLPAEGTEIPDVYQQYMDYDDEPNESEASSFPNKETAKAIGSAAMITLLCGITSPTILYLIRERKSVMRALMNKPADLIESDTKKMLSQKAASDEATTETNVELKFSECHFTGFKSISEKEWESEYSSYLIDMYTGETIPLDPEIKQAIQNKWVEILVQLRDAAKHETMLYKELEEALKFMDESDDQANTEVLANISEQQKQTLLDSNKYTDEIHSLIMNTIEDKLETTLDVIKGERWDMLRQLKETQINLSQMGILFRTVLQKRYDAFYHGFLLSTNALDGENPTVAELQSSIKNLTAELTSRQDFVDSFPQCHLQDLVKDSNEQFKELCESKDQNTRIDNQTKKLKTELQSLEQLSGLYLEELRMLDRKGRTIRNFPSWLKQVLRVPVPYAHQTLGTMMDGARAVVYYPNKWMKMKNMAVTALNKSKKVFQWTKTISRETVLVDIHDLGETAGKAYDNVCSKVEAIQEKGVTLLKGKYGERGWRDFPWFIPDNETRTSVVKIIDQLEEKKADLKKQIEEIESEKVDQESIDMLKAKFEKNQKIIANVIQLGKLREEIKAKRQKCMTLLMTNDDAATSYYCLRGSAAMEMIFNQTFENVIETIRANCRKSSIYLSYVMQLRKAKGKKIETANVLNQIFQKGVRYRVRPETDN